MIPHITRGTAQHSEDESYFVSMTDLMVGMLFVFIIILMAFALNLRKQASDLDNTIDDLTAARETRAVLLHDIKRSLELQGVTVDVDVNNGILRLPERLLFQSGAYRIRDDGRAALRHLADVLAGVLPCFATMVEPIPPPTCPVNKGGRLEAVYIEGHTDNVPIYTYAGAKIASNWELSAARAIAVYDILLGFQPILGALRNDDTAEHAGQMLIGVSGYGEHRPAVPNVNETARALNRRIDLRFLMATPSREKLDAVDRSVGRKIGHVDP